MPIKVSELFYSVQGEGRYMGVPSIFLRVFGCNFHCSGFGMPRGELSKEREAINPANQNTYDQLPLVSTGCDSYASWDPRFKHLSPLLEIDAIVDRIMELLPHGEWRDEHLVITGGEPLLGWQREYPKLLSHPKMQGLKEITFETNGTQALTPKFAHFLEEWVWPEERPGFGVFGREITFSVSAKLPCSGHSFKEAIKPEVLQGYADVGYTYLKFVVATEEDIQDAETAVSMYKAVVLPVSMQHIPIYLMPVGGVESVYSLNNKNVALAALARGWRYSDRLQVPLFKNAWAT
jgi:organic radical activating enzyme